MRGIVFKFFLLITLLITSCVKYNDTIVFNEDFSGTDTIEFYISNVILDTDAGRELVQNFKKMKEDKNLKGIKLIEKKVENLGSETKFTIKLQFSSLDALNKLTNSDKENSKLNETFKLVEENDYFKYTRTITPTSKDENKPKTEADIAAENLAKMVLAEYVWTFKVKFPYEVVKTNGNLKEDKKTVEWKYDVYTLVEKGVKMEALVKKPSLLDKIVNFFKSIINAILSIFK